MKKKTKSFPESSYLLHFVCTKCCSSFKKYGLDPIDAKQVLILKCAACEGPSYNCGRHFKPPKKEDSKQWEKVNLLISEGFWFQTVYEKNPESGGFSRVEYPETMGEVLEFVQRFENDLERQYLKKAYKDSIS